MARTQLGLLQPLVQSLARARFAHYEQCRRSWGDHLNRCRRCQLHIRQSSLNRYKPISLCPTGIELRRNLEVARNKSIGEPL